MREILFRGKTKQSKWVYGLLGCNYFRPNEKYYYIHNCETDDTEYEVTPKTIGQFTGLTDKNGKKIFEGDIVKWNEKEWGGPYNELVEFDYELLTMREHDYEQWCEVIGNIHDNPELLKEQENE